MKKKIITIKNIKSGVGEGRGGRDRNQRHNSQHRAEQDVAQSAKPLWTLVKFVQMQYINYSHT